MAISQYFLSPILTNPTLSFFFFPVILLTVRFLYRISAFHPLSHIPGPLLARTTSLWLTYHAWIGDEASTVHSLHARYGPIVRTGPYSIDILDGDALATIYTEKGGFTKADFYSNFDIDGHKSIFSETDVSRRAPRAKAVAHLFSTSSLRQGQDVIYKCVDRFVDRLAQGSRPENKGKPLNVLNLTRGLAVDAVSSYLFDDAYGALDEDSVQNEKHSVRHEVKDSVHSDQEMSASGMVDCFVAVGRFWYLPSWAFQLLERFDAWWNTEDEVSHSLTLVDEFVARVVSQAEGAIQAYENDVSSHKQSPPPGTYPARMLLAGFTQSEVRAQCKDLIFAGTDSTGMNVASILFHLARNPEIYRSVREEIVQANPTFDELQSLPRLRNVIKEGLRISMANPSRLPRVVPAQGWMFKSTFFPAGTVVSCTPYSLHFNPDVFPDPFEFKPERWENATDEMVRDSIPFGLGLRQCIARNLATVELYCAVERVLRADVLARARTADNHINILEWFNSKVVGERIDLVWE
ncbi:hypothetical protein PV10_04389 [Exophiala mesophila]|uniref:Cytochrome P450 n=1 Tax=Exophiala mesophila TaxID=212818 RepID=A0A0D1XY43_EXOME|nr:uncharacterized protein PV10_04389 [Exophiala mesophila]KIV93151.1 hypothetical protein PV10_04389 [Exophiala mesophila]